MSTRSTKGILLPNGKVVTSYTHSDGYPEYMAKMLHDHYRTYTKAKDLIELGDASMVKVAIDPPGPITCNHLKLPEHSFDTPCPHTSVFYHRDRGEAWEDVKPKEFDSIEEYVEYAKETDSEFIYLALHEEGCGVVSWYVMPIAYDANEIYMGSRFFLKEGVWYKILDDRLEPVEGNPA